jgi:hypothetical protein
MASSLDAADSPLRSISIQLSSYNGKDTDRINSFINSNPSTNRKHAPGVFFPLRSRYPFTGQFNDDNTRHRLNGLLTPVYSIEFWSDSDRGSDDASAAQIVALSM